MDGYCVWVDTIKKIASFHHVEQSDFMHFLQHETFMAYLCTVPLTENDSPEWSGYRGRP